MFSSAGVFHFSFLLEKQRKGWRRRQDDDDDDALRLPRIRPGRGGGAWFDDHAGLPQLRGCRSGHAVGGREVPGDGAHRAVHLPLR